MGLSSLSPYAISQIPDRKRGDDVGQRLRTVILADLLLISVFLSNLFYAWTSQALARFPPLNDRIPTFANQLMSLSGTASYFDQTASAFCYSVGDGCLVQQLAVREFIDCEILVLLGVIGATTFLLYAGKGLGRATAKMLQVASLSVMPLGLEVLAFDRREFWVHVSAAQVTTGFLTWFSNADLLGLSVAVFIISTVSLRRASAKDRRRRDDRQRRGSSDLASPAQPLTKAGDGRSVV